MRVMSAQIAIIGAGPYGLSIAATLKAGGQSCKIFGKPMETWRTAMPAGMNLKSDGFASNLYTPTEGDTLADFCRRQGVAYDDQRVLVKLGTFIGYGLDFQARRVPDLDRRDVVLLQKNGAGFELTLEDGAIVAAEKVIVAAGVTHFDYTPPVLAALPPTKMTHSRSIREVGHLAGKDVTVVGAGSSAVELAAALAGAGARTRLLARAERIRFHGAPSPKKRTLWQRLRHPKSGLGPGARSWLCCAMPGAYRRLPASWRLAFLERHLGPQSQYHLRAALERDVELLLRHQIASAEETEDGVRLVCSDGDGKPVVFHTNYVIAATGYRADCERLTFIEPKLRSSIRNHAGNPILSSRFESSAPGLYFVGLAAAGSFGPLMRFVYGAEYAARRISAHLR